MENSENTPAGKSKNFIRYYKPEGENDAFKNLNGAFKRAVEEEASIQTAVKIKNSYPEEKYNNWAGNHENEPEIEKRARLEFIKKCEELSLLPENELQKMLDRSSERLASQFFHKRGSAETFEAAIKERVYKMHSSYEK